MQQEQRYHYHIPFIGEQNKKDEIKLTIIGLIDVSASMFTRWEWVSNFWNKSIPKENLITLTFDHRAKKVNNNILSPNIEDHGEGTTEIVPAFELLEKEIVKVPHKNNITVIFISDGQDNNVKTIEQRMQQRLKGNVQKRNINFICLGIENEFPTVLSMRLRDLYHKGDPQIPALYLIEHASEQAFFNKFETMKRYFYPSKMLRVDKLVNLFPYDEEVTDEVYEGQWVVGNHQVLVFPEYPIAIPSVLETELLIDDVVDLFRSWVQNIQIRVMGKQENALDKAKICYQLMTQITDRLTQQFKMDVLNFKMEEINDLNQPFHIRAKRNYAYKYGNKLLFFVNEIKQLSEGSNPNEVDDFEAAKRLNIGTIVGKHHQKALALKGINIEEFTKIKIEFQQIVLNCNIKPHNEQGQERSVISLENQRDILSDKESILEGSKFIKTQYDFAETFPLVGHGLKVKRNDGCFVNPWLVQVLSLAKHNKVVDSAYLIKNNFNINLQIGNNEIEEINCILPLFPESDSDLQPILRCKIMKLLLTFMVQQNVDTLYEETYLALMANALICILKKEKSEWRQNLIDQIFTTIKIVYSGTNQFENYLQKLLQNPVQAYFQKEAEYEDYVSTAKPFIYLFYLMSLGNVVQDFDQQIENLILYYFNREQFKHDHLLSHYLRLKFGQNDQNNVQEQLKSTFEKHVSVRHFREAITKEIEAVMISRFENESTVVELNEDKVYNKDVKLTLEAIESFYELFTGKKFPKQKYIHLIYHSLRVQEKDLFTTKIDYNNLILIQKTLVYETNGDITKGTQSLKTALEKEYMVWFIQNHMMVQPLTYEQLQIECAQRGIDHKTIAYNIKSGLSSNCCMSKQCPFYLIVNGLDFKRHIQAWGRKVPQGFHKFVREEILKGQQIELIIQSAAKKWKNFPKLYLGNEEVVHKYIKMISETLPQEYIINDLPKQQLLHHQVKLTFPKRQKVKKYQNKRGKQRQNLRGRGRGRGKH